MTVNRIINKHRGGFQVTLWAEVNGKRYGYCREMPTRPKEQLLKQSEQELLGKLPKSDELRLL